MKLFVILLVFASLPVMAAECKLTGVLESTLTIETSFVTETMESCKTMAENTKSNNFYGFVEKEDRLIETRMQFKENEISRDVVSFDSEESI